MEEEEEENRTPLSLLHESVCSRDQEKEDEGKTMNKKGRCAPAHFHNPPSELGHSILWYMAIILRRTSSKSVCAHLPLLAAYLGTFLGFVPM